MISDLVGRGRLWLLSKGIGFGPYALDKETGRPNFHPHFAWSKTFKCIPIMWVGNLYLMRRAGVLL